MLKSTWRRAGYWRHSIVTLIASGVTTSAGFGFSIIAIHILGVNLYGRFVYLQGVSLLLIFPYATVWQGISTLFSSRTVSPNGVMKWLASLAFMYTLASVCVWILFDTGSVREITALSVYELGLLVSNALVSVLRATAEFRRAGTIQALSALAPLGAVIASSYQGEALYLFFTLTGVFNALISIAVSLNPTVRSLWRGRFDMARAVKHGRSLVVGIGAVNVADSFLLNGSRVILGTISPPVIVTVYDVAMRMVQLGRTVVTSVFGNFTPLFGKALSEHDTREISWIYEGLVQTCDSFSTLVYGGLIMLGPWLLHVYPGVEPEHKIWMVMLFWLALGSLLHSSTVVQSSFMLSQNQTRGIAPMEITSLSIFVCGYVVIETLHLPGSLLSVATGLSMALSGLIYSSVADKEVLGKFRKHLFLRLTLFAGPTIFYLAHLNHQLAPWMIDLYTTIGIVITVIPISRGLWTGWRTVLQLSQYASKAQSGGYSI